MAFENGKKLRVAREGRKTWRICCENEANATAHVQSIYTTVSFYTTQKLSLNCVTNWCDFRRQKREHFTG